MRAARQRGPGAGPQNEIHSIEMLVEAYADLVFRVAYARLGSPCDAQDACQTVFLKLLSHQWQDKRHNRLRDGDHQKAWLIRTTITTCIDMQRDGWRSRVEPVDEQFPAPQAEDPAEVVEATAQAADLLNQVNSLTPACRTAIYLHYYEGYSPREIARLTKETPATVRKHLSRGRARPHAMLEGRNGGTR